MARRKKNPGLGTLLGLAALGGLGYVVYKSMNEAKASTTKKSKIGKKDTVELPDIPCSPGQLEGQFTDKNGDVWMWWFQNIYDTKWAVTALSDGRRQDVGSFALDTPHDELCRALKNHFQSLDLAK